MAAETALKLVLLGQDRSAGKTLDDVGRKAGKTGGIMSKFGGMGKAAMLGVAGAALAAIPAVVDFGKDSLAAFADAEKSQKQLEDAYKRFPKIASVNIAKLRDYNQALQDKGYADADDIASGQASLARYKLTGDQLKRITPLLVDYANRTGKDIPTAAAALGKGLSGSSRLAKELGFSFKDAKDPAKNFDQILAGLQGTVGGYSSKLPEAERNSKALGYSFGDLQENVGEKLQPALIGLVDAGQGVLDWLSETPEVGAAAGAVWDMVGLALQGLGWVATKVVVPALTMLMYPIKWLADGAAHLLDALGNVPGFEWAKTAASKLRTVSTGMGKIIEAGKKLSSDPPKMTVNDRQAKSKMAAIDKKIAALNKKRVEVKSKGDTKGVDKIDAEIKRLQKKKKDIKVGVGLKRSGPQNAAVRKVSSSNWKLSMYASGHPSTPSGAWALVGEHGPELAQLPAGTRVLSNAQSRSKVAQSRGAGGGDTYITVTAPAGAPKAFAEAVERELYDLMRSRGPKGKLKITPKG